MSKYIELKWECYEANMEFNVLGLVIYIFGNVSVVDWQYGLFVIKFSGVFYEMLCLEDIVMVDFDNQIVEGSL